MGVELGKVLAKAILAQLGKPEDVTGHDSSVRVSVFRLRPFLDADIPRNRRPASFTTTRNTGRSRYKLIVYDEACKTVTPLGCLWAQILKMTLKNQSAISF